MLTERDIVARVQHVTVTRLRIWVRHGWIVPADQKKEGFSEADMARAALIRDLEDKLGFDEEQVPVLLNLIDQIHGLRAELRTALAVMDDLPPEVRASLRTRVAGPKRRR